MQINVDLSDYAHQVSEMFHVPVSEEEWDSYKLTDEQVSFFHENGYLAGIKVLDEWQVDQLNEELPEIMDAGHPGHELLYEFHTNESTDPDRILFHSLGHWRMTPGVS